MKKIRWGVISSAKIGTEKVIPAMQQSETGKSWRLPRGTRKPPNGYVKI